ncbi:unnamed protein product [Microthlaspi erraticum]|uniref:Uncharacterized protein n=1 Tax=Microthlaspi erraticum TaxID=1685480 RepID=A0A6D2KZ08_9BRAS|nr:unnamed protein product [Microthlaspi erraticum]
MNLQQRSDEQAIALQEILAKFEQDLCDKLRRSMEPVLQVLQRSHVLPPRDDVFFDDEGNVLLKEIHGAPIFDVYDDTNPISDACDGANLFCDEENPIFDVYDDTNLISSACDGADLICHEGDAANLVFDVMNDEDSANDIFHKKEIDVIGIHELFEDRITNLVCHSNEDLSNEVHVTMFSDSYVDIYHDEIHASDTAVYIGPYPDPVIVMDDKDVERQILIEAVI